MWRNAPTRRGDARMSAIFGSTRAQLLRKLVLPQTTLELATALDLKTPTVSEHLAAFAIAGVVNRVRVGRRVYYSLSERGLALSEALGP